MKDLSTVKSDGTITLGGLTSMSGYTIIDADLMDTALTIVKASRFLDIAVHLKSLN